MKVLVAIDLPDSMTAEAVTRVAEGMLRGLKAQVLTEVETDLIVDLLEIHTDAHESVYDEVNSVQVAEGVLAALTH